MVTSTPTSQQPSISPTPASICVGTTTAFDIDYEYFSLTSFYATVEFATYGSGYDTYLYFQTATGEAITECDDCGDCAVSGTHTILTVPNVTQEIMELE